MEKEHNIKLVILAGGKGERLGLIDKPKPMVEICGKPLLELQIDLAKRYGIKDIFILSGYLSEKIKDYFQDGSKFGVNIKHITETKSLGTAGAVAQLKNIINEPFIVFYGDLIMDFDLSLFIKFHESSNRIASIVVHPNNHPFDSDLVELDKENNVKAFHSKPHKETWNYSNLVNAAVYILNPEIFDFIEENKYSDFGHDIFPFILEKGGIIKGYKTSEYIKDMGTKERFAEIQKDYETGKVRRFNKDNKRKAIFLDRDGVINKDKNNIRKVNDFELIDGAVDAIKNINLSEYLAIVVTNQPVIAKGFCSSEVLDEIHKKMETLLGQNGAYLDGLYYCPHHPEKGFDGEIEELKVDCECRKPKAGMIFRAASDFNFDLDGSYMVGDREVDVNAGKNAGIKTVLIEQNTDNNTDLSEADHVFSNLENAVNYIVSNK